MTDPTTPTVPPPSPGDQLVSRVILCVFALAVLCVGSITLLAVLDQPRPEVLESMTVATITALATLLAGRTRP